jgi:hypothetical protein
VIISRDLDGKHPWLAAVHPVPVLHLLRAAEITGSSVDDVSARLTRLGFRIAVDQFAHLAEGIIGSFGPDDATIVSRDLDGEQPWLDASEPVQVLHLLRAAKAVDWDVADVAARLMLLGFTVRTDQGGLDIDRKTREDLLIVASSDLDGEDEFLDPDEKVQPGHVLKAARRTHGSPDQVTQWLRQVGYTVDDPPAVPPDGIRSADITLLSADLDGEQPWLDLDHRVSLGHLFAAARKARAPIADVRARLEWYGFRTADPAVRLPRLRPGGAWHPLLEVATADPTGLPGHVSALAHATGLTDGAVGRWLRDAVITSLLSTRRPDPDAVEALRRLAAGYDQSPPAIADSDEVDALLFDGALHREVAWFEAGIDRLSTIDHLEAPGRDDGEVHGTPSDVATMVADLAGDRRDVPWRLAPHLHKLDFSGEPLERILAQLVAVSLVDNRRELVTDLVALVPEPVTFDILAFNLACMHARYGDRHGAIRYTRVALELGKSPDQFLADHDFATLRHDPEFVAVLDEHRLPRRP